MHAGVSRLSSWLKRHLFAPVDRNEMTIGADLPSREPWPAEVIEYVEYRQEVAFREVGEKLGLGSDPDQVRKVLWPVPPGHRKLTPEEYTGATFSVSNLGMLGIHEFTAIINPPEAGILAIGAMEDTPVVVDGAVVVRPRMRITMCCDHRVIDGATGARFLQTLRAMLEEPAAILL